jgi:hypothetical protein
VLGTIIDRDLRKQRPLTLLQIQRGDMSDFLKGMSRSIGGHRIAPLVTSGKLSIMEDRCVQS